MVFNAHHTMYLCRDTFALQRLRSENDDRRNSFLVNVVSSGTDLHDKIYSRSFFQLKVACTKENYTNMVRSLVTQFELSHTYLFCKM